MTIDVPEVSAKVVGPFASVGREESRNGVIATIAPARKAMMSELLDFMVMEKTVQDKRFLQKSIESRITTKLQKPLSTHPGEQTKGARDSVSVPQPNRDK